MNYFSLELIIATGGKSNLDNFFKSDSSNQYLWSSYKSKSLEGTTQVRNPSASMELNDLFLDILDDTLHREEKDVCMYRRDIYCSNLL